MLKWQNLQADKNFSSWFKLGWICWPVFDDPFISQSLRKIFLGLILVSAYTFVNMIKFCFLARFAIDDFLHQVRHALEFVTAIIILSLWIYTHVQVVYIMYMLYISIFYFSQFLNLCFLVFLPLSNFMPLSLLSLSLFLSLSLSLSLYIYIYIYIYCYIYMCIYILVSTWCIQ